jgi:hypothetical protein
MSRCSIAPALVLWELDGENRLKSHRLLPSPKAVRRIFMVERSGLFLTSPKNWCGRAMMSLCLQAAIP